MPLELPWRFAPRASDWLSLQSFTSVLLPLAARAARARCPWLPSADRVCQVRFVFSSSATRVFLASLGTGAAAAEGSFTIAADSIITGGLAPFTAAETTAADAAAAEIAGGVGSGGNVRRRLAGVAGMGPAGG